MEKHPQYDSSNKITQIVSKTIKCSIPLSKHMKYVFIEFSNGEVFKVPAEVIAENRAEYYASLDSKRYEDVDYEDVFEGEKEHTLSDELELLDWLKNRMNWEDIEEEAEKVDIDQNISYNDEFTNAEFSVGETYQG